MVGLTKLDPSQVETQNSCARLKLFLFAFEVEKETKKLREHLVTDSLVCQLQVGAVMVACNRVTVRVTVVTR